MTSHRPIIGHCVTCGGVDLVLTKTGYCPACYKQKLLEAARANNRRTIERRKARGLGHYKKPSTGRPTGRPPQTPKPWIILEDALPVERGGFRPGAELGRQDVYYGLIEGAFKTGMRLKSPEGVEYVVRFGYLYDADGALCELKK